MQEIIKEIESAVNEMVASRPLPPGKEIEDAADVLGQVVMQTYVHNVKAGNKDNAKILMDAMGCIQVAVIKYPMIIEDMKRKIALLEEAIAREA